MDVYGGRSCTTVSAADEGPGVATYRLPTPTGSGYTLLGSPMVTADLQVTGEFAYIAARLADVDPATNTKTLVSRGAYRMDPNALNGQQTFQINETHGTLRPATSRSSSCWAGTRHSCAPPMGSSRSRCRIWSCGCLSMKSPVPAARLQRSAAL